MREGLPKKYYILESRPRGNIYGGIEFGMFSDNSRLILIPCFNRNERTNPKNGASIGGGGRLLALEIEYNGNIPVRRI